MTYALISYYCFRVTDLLHKARAHAIEITLVIMTALWAVCWDYLHLENFTRTGRLKLFLACGFLVLAVKIAKDWGSLISCFYAYAMLSVVHFTFTPQGIVLGGKTHLYYADGLCIAICITLTLLVIPELARRISSPWLDLTVIAAGLFHSVLGFFNIRGVYPMLPAVPERVATHLPIGTMGQQTILGGFMAFAFVVAADSVVLAKGAWHKRVLCAIALLFFVVTIMTKSSMSYASLGAGVVVLVLFHIGVFPAIGVVLAGIASIVLAAHFYPHLADLTGRHEPWGDLLDLHKYRPWFGYGLGGWESLSRGIQHYRGLPRAWTHAHSDFLQILFELGRVGVIFTALVALLVASKVWFLYQFRERQNVRYIAGVAIFAVNAAGNFTFHLVPHGPLFALCLFVVIRSFDAPKGADST